MFQVSKINFPKYKLPQKETAKPHQQSANTTPLLRIQNDDLY
jgi:hypothetical protein